MKLAGKIVLTIIFNVLLFFILQIVGVFSHFLIYGSGAMGEKYSTLIALFFAIIQIVAVVIVYCYKWIVKDLYIVLVSMVLVVALYFYFVYIPEHTFGGY